MPSLPRQRAVLSVGLSAPAAFGRKGIPVGRKRRMERAARSSRKRARFPPKHGENVDFATLLPDARLFGGMTLLRLRGGSARNRTAEWTDNEKAHLRRRSWAAIRGKCNALQRRGLAASRTAAAAAGKSPCAPRDGLCRRQGILRRTEWEKLRSAAPWQGLLADSHSKSSACVPVRSKTTDLSSHV